MIGNEKTNTQVIIQPKYQNIKNQSLNYYTGTRYTSAHPLKIWRRTGTHQHLASSILSKSTPCRKCAPTGISVGLPFKMLGKNSNGVNKITSVSTTESCTLCDPTKGPVGTNSAGAKIRSAVTLLNKHYYTSNLSYLKSRCNTIDTNKVIQQRDGITYFKNGNYVWPSNSSDNSAIYNSNCSSDKDTCCNTTIYKPSNPQYGIQGGVSNSARVARLKYNTITKNNNTLAKQYNVHFTYNGNNNSLYFAKSKEAVCVNNCYTNRLRMRN
jgi:hypothetical protein|tara:strand:- start:1455 stop:2258 length:804 start_codon:yes stop_codon:yes gene_type:complete